MSAQSTHLLERLRMQNKMTNCVNFTLCQWDSKWKFNLKLHETYMERYEIPLRSKLLKVIFFCAVRILRDKT